MYVIYPADELILMTYGPALPRIKPRPTLDCLHDPLVLNYGRTLFSNDTSQQQQAITSKKVNTAPLHKPPPSPRSTKQQQSLMHTSAHDESSRTRSTISRNESSAVQPYGLIESPENPVEDPSLDEYGMSRERSPSIYLDPPSPDLSASRPTSSSSSKPKSKLRSKLNISLGRLGRQQREINESARLREDLHLHVENPTFTRENLSQRNFDAFFESGEPVYKLHPKPTSSTNLTADSLSPSSSFDGSPKASSSSSGFGRLKVPLSSRSKSSADSDKKTSDVPQKGSRRPQQQPLKTTTTHADSPRSRPSFSRNESSCSAVEPYGLSESPEAPIDDPNLSDYEISRERSPSIYLEPPSPSLSTNRPTSPTSAKQKSSETKSKLRPKLNISLGRLGRQQREINESARLREDLHLHVENPTFTRENLSQRNFDAFFESGEPVYKLHPKPTSSTNLTADPLSPSTSFDQTSGSKSADIDSEQKTGVPQKDFLGKSSDGPKERSIFEWREPCIGSLPPRPPLISC